MIRGGGAQFLTAKTNLVQLVLAESLFLLFYAAGHTLHFLSISKFCEGSKKVRTLRLFSHESKVRNLNYHLNCAFWITQCTHERSNCDIWITQCTHERPNLGFCIPAGEECLGTLPIKHARSSHFLCFYTYMQRAVYRRKWLEGHLAPPPNHNLEVRAFIRWFRCIICEMRKLENTSGPSFEMRISNDASRCNLAYTRSKIPSFEF